MGNLSITPLVVTDTDKFGATGKINTAWNTLDAGVAGRHPITASGSDVLLTAAQSNNRVLDITGTLTAPVSIIFPAARKGLWVVKNGTTGMFPLTASLSGGGAGTLVVQGSACWIYADGNDVFPLSNAISILMGETIGLAITETLTTSILVVEAFSIGVAEVSTIVPSSP